MRKSNIYAFALIASGLCSFFYPSRAVADPIDVVNINFSGQVACLTSLTPACGTSTGTVTGTFSYDPDTNSITGSWSFSTPLGFLSSTSADSFGGGACNASSGSFDQCFFGMTFPGSSDNTVVDLFLTFNKVGGPLLIGDFSFVESDQCPISGGACSKQDAYIFTSGGGSTPEPSSLLLLGTGLLLGLGPLIRRFALT